MRIHDVNVLYLVLFGSHPSNALRMTRGPTKPQDVASRKRGTPLVTSPGFTITSETNIASLGFMLVTFMSLGLLGCDAIITHLWLRRCWSMTFVPPFPWFPHGPPGPCPSPRFGCTDGGEKAIENFFHHHRCGRLSGEQGCEMEVSKVGALAPTI